MAYPLTLDTFTDRVDGVDDVVASDVNLPHNAIEAIEIALGTMPRVVTNTAPGVGDDSADGYSVGTHWYNTTLDLEYVAIDVTVGAAIWMPMPMASVAWTPVVTQGAATPTISIARARYQVHGKWVHIMCNLTVTSAGSAGNAIRVGGWPTAINAIFPGYFGAAGVGGVYDSGATFYNTVANFAADVLNVYFRWQPTGDYLGINPNFALANNDEIYLNAHWEIA